MSKRNVIGLVVLSLAAACAADPGGATDVVQVDDALAPLMSSAAIGAYENDCTRVFSPSPEAYEYVARAAERWARATGCDVRVGEGGIPVVMVDEILDLDGNRAAGVSNVEACNVASIEIARYASRPSRVALHEMGHALSQPCNVYDGTGHADTGIMTPDSAADVIDAASLSLICEGGLDCRTFNPEA